MKIENEECHELHEKAADSGFPDRMSRARHGKIARLPRHLREEINRRLDANQSGVKILVWLNGQPEARQILERQFGGKPVNLQNLSNWRRNGFYEWQRFQFAAETVDRKVAASPGKSLLEAAIDPLERVTAVECFATYERAIESVDARKKFKYLCQVLHEVNAMRRHEHRRAWQTLQEEKAGYEYKRFCRTPSHCNQSPSRSNQSQSQQIKVDQDEKFEGHPTFNVQSNASIRVEARKHAEAWTPSALQSGSSLQPNPSKSDHIKVDQGEKKKLDDPPPIWWAPA